MWEKKCLIDWLKTILVKNGGHIKIPLTAIGSVCCALKLVKYIRTYFKVYSVNHFKSIKVKEFPSFVELVSNRDTLPREAELTQKCFSNKETDCEENEIITFCSVHSVHKIQWNVDQSRSWNAAADFQCSHLCTILPRLFVSVQLHYWLITPCGPCHIVFSFIPPLSFPLSTFLFSELNIKTLLTWIYSRYPKPAVMRHTRLWPRSIIFLFILCV